MSSRAPHLPSPDPTRRTDADRFVGELLDAPAERRPALREALRRDDPVLAALVDSLLVHLGEVDGFLEGEASVPIDDGGAFVGMRFGHWAVRRAIGRGGMGLVFEVERDDGVVAQRAALKLLQRAFGDRTILARFATERQILAGLDHPSIARLIDAGASEGRPYLVMDYVDGVPLDAWCDERALPFDARIRLFNRVCDAVHYAHQRLVVHRDLKPGNILVTADGTPKLLDFGISKLIDDDGRARAETIDAATLLTPRYASPEQLTGGPISTASDVYSLGVLLFELLTGTTPYRTRDATLVEMMRAVLTEEPARASDAVATVCGDGPKASERATANAWSIADESPERVARRLRGDLDQILAKALARDPAARYESAAALRDDLERHLRGSPIAAVPPSWRYRAGKFVRKHRGAVSAATVFVIAIVALGILASWQAYRADEARDVAEAARARADRRFEDTRTLAHALIFDLDDAIATGPTKAREQLVRTALEYLDRLAQDRSSPSLQLDVAAGYERIADILGNQSSSNLGRSDEARLYLQKALAIRERLAQDVPDDLTNLRGLINVNESLGYMARFGGNPEEAARRFSAATAHARRQLELRPDDPVSHLTLFARRRTEALMLFSPGRPSLHRLGDALDAYRTLIVDVDAYGAAHPGLPRVPYLTEIFVHELTVLLLVHGDADEALQTARRDIALTEDVVRLHPDDPGAQRDLALAIRTAGEALVDGGRHEAGMALLVRSMEIRQRIADADPTNARAAREVAIGHSVLAAGHEARDPRRALAEYETWARLTQAALTKEPSNIGHRLDLAEARLGIAAMHLAMEQHAVALAEARRLEAEVLAFDETTRRQDEAREVYGKARMIEARSLARAGSRADLRQALDITGEAIATLDALSLQAPGDARGIRDVARARIEAGTIALAAPGGRERGCASIEEGERPLRALRDGHRLATSFDAVLEAGAAALARCREGSPAS